jgi:hypothetical protein
MSLRLLFVLEAVFSVVTGAGLLLAPGATLDLYGLDTDPVGRFMTQTAAGLYIGVGLLAWFLRGVADPGIAIRVTAAYAVYHLVLLVVAAIAWLGSDFDFDLGWVSVLVEVAFAAAFGWFSYRARAAGGRS